MNEQTSSDSRPKIEFSIEDFDLENFNVKPINKGLGFHGKPEEIFRPSRSVHKMTAAPITQKEKPTPLPPVFTRPAVKIESKPLENLFSEKKQTPINEMISMADEPAAAEKRVMAFVIDIAILVLANGLLWLSFMFLAGLELKVENWFKVFTFNETIIFLTVFFSLSYLFYFSLLDMSSTVGKTLLGLKVKSTKEGTILRVGDTVVRSIFSLLSFVAIGLPLLLDFHSRLSDTKVIKD